ncbi:peptide ABC transporter permease [Lacticaseibacillus paracasei subsp. tolerans]|nr:peptide ABC transporter permease [Lacticaseibacillus paracasei]QPI89685.1 peptide ABC transporter permease [Lacticaseibacillus paracasei subsp. tolerans]
MFYLSLLVAIIHVGVALPFVQRLLRVFGLTNWYFFLNVSLITLAILALVYVLVYKVTRNIYYRVVSE